MMKYPISFHSFDQIITDGFVYVDKTDMIYRLATEGKVYFFSRPRRFGKSLLVSTLKNYFLGRKELFKGLAIDGLETEWATYPVFHIDFSGERFTEAGTLEKKIEDFIAEGEEKYGKSPTATTRGNRLAYVFNQAHRQTGRRCVILVDEYDKPVLDVLHSDVTLSSGGWERSLKDDHLSTLRAFYSISKLACDDIGFMFLTGETKLLQWVILDCYNGAHICLYSPYEALCGFTRQELETYFAEPIQQLAEKYDCTPAEMKNRIACYYNGYHFSRSMTDIYNPFSLLHAFEHQELRDYWFSSSDPASMIQLLNREQVTLKQLTGNYYSADVSVDYRRLEEKALPMLCQRGYLTIKGYDPRWNTFRLDFPNKEVKEGMERLGVE